MTRFVLASVLLVGGMSVIASAQDYRYLMPNFYGGGTYHHASTVEEGAARGMADVIRSSGAANLMNSEAAINYEQARKGYIENRMQWTDTYFQMRRVNKQAREAERGPPPTQEQLIRVSQSRLPDRLSASKVDPLTGAIQWPLALQSEVFAAERQQLEKLYGERAREGQFSPSEFLEVKKLTSEMLSQLRRSVSSFPGNVSIDARKFLESLAYEAQFQAG